MAPNPNVSFDQSLTGRIVKLLFCVGLLAVAGLWIYGLYNLITDPTPINTRTQVMNLGLGIVVGCGILAFANGLRLVPFSRTLRKIIWGSFVAGIITIFVDSFALSLRGKAAENPFFVSAAIVLDETKSPEKVRKGQMPEKLARRSNHDFETDMTGLVELFVISGAELGADGQYHLKMRASVFNPETGLATVSEEVRDVEPMSWRMRLSPDVVTQLEDLTGDMRHKVPVMWIWNRKFSWLSREQVTVCLVVRDEVSGKMAEIKQVFRGSWNDGSLHPAVPETG